MERSTESKIRSQEEEIASIKERISFIYDCIQSIDTRLGITLDNLVGNDSDPQYQQLIEEKRELRKDKDRAEKEKDTAKSILLQLLQIQTALVEKDELYAQATKWRKLQSSTYEPVSLGSITPSAFSTSPENTKHSKREIVPLYQHWFAIELYKCILTVRLGSMCTTKTVNKYTVNKYTASVPKSSLDQFVHMIGVITNPTSTTTGYMSQKGLSDFEVFKTAQLARELDRFLFDDNKKHDGTCYHQMCSQF